MKLVDDFEIQNEIQELQEAFDKIKSEETGFISLSGVVECFKSLKIEAPLSIIQEYFDKVSSKGSGIPSKLINFEEFQNIYRFIGYRKESFQTTKNSKIPACCFAFSSANQIAYLQKNSLTLKKIIDEEVVETMEKRLKEGYALRPDLNAKIFPSKKNPDFKINPLNDVWVWVDKCKKYKQRLDEMNQDGFSKEKSPEPDPADGIISLIDIEEDEDSRSDFSYEIYGQYVQRSENRDKALRICGWTTLPFFNSNSSSVINLGTTLTEKGTSADMALRGGYPTLESIVKELTNAGQHFRAAAIAVFHFDFQRALKVLDGVDFNEYGNEIQYLRGILSGLQNIQRLVETDPHIRQNFIMHYKQKDHKNNLKVTPSGREPTMSTPNMSLKQNELQNLDPKMKVFLFEQNFKFIQALCSKAEFKQPYLRCVGRFIANKSRAETHYILNDTNISHFDRVAFALRFLKTDSLKQYFQGYSGIDIKTHQNLLDLVILIGRKEKMISIMQWYLDNTKDLQTIGLLSAIFSFLKFPCENNQLNNWYMLYKELLNRLQLWDQRAQLDQMYLELERLFDSRKPAKSGGIHDNNSIIQRCYFCTSPLNHDSLQSTLGPRKKGYMIFSRSEKPRMNLCPDCTKPLPNCAVCLLPNSIVNPFIELQEKFKRGTSKTKDNISEGLNIDEGLVWCQTCRHGGHLLHIMEWFEEFNTCPVTDCPCQCLLL